MSILLGILGAMGVLGLLLWRLHMAAEAAKGIAETATDARGLFRRWHWRRKFAADTLDLVRDPREAVVAMMVSAAQYDGALTERERDAILECVTGVPGAIPAQAEELLAHARWLTKDTHDLDHCLIRFTPLLRQSCSPQQLSETVAVVTRVAEADGSPGDAIRSSLQRLRRDLVA